MEPETNTNNHLSLTPDELHRLEQKASRLGFGSVEDLVRRALLDDQPKEVLPAAKEGDRVFGTDLGEARVGDSQEVMGSVSSGSVDLIMTSPPFALVREKAYGNEAADGYLKWFAPFAAQFHRILRPSGSLVIDIGGAWNPGQPTRSLYHFELLVMLCRRFGFYLAQEFFWWNPAKLPTPAEWVTVRRVRVKDAVNCVWWLSKTPFPKASNRRVLQPYSKSMERLLRSGYKPKLRPSGHDISSKFKNRNEGAIPPNLLAIANTESNSQYQQFCRGRDLPEHPARFPSGLPEFFVRFLTDVNDMVVDPFAGSCVTGEVAERMKRRWLCIEENLEYLQGAKGRFLGEQTDLLNGGSSGRRAPYEIHPPNMLPLGDNPESLADDGGATRSGDSRRERG